MWEWVNNIIRGLFWGLGSALLWLMDMCYSLIEEIISVNFFGESYVWDVWGAISLFLGFLIIYRVSARAIKAYFDEEAMEKFHIGSIFVRTGVVIAITAAFPLLIGAVNTTGYQFVSNVGLFGGVSSGEVPSTTIISTYIEGDRGENITYTLDDIDIKEKEGDFLNETYKFFPDLMDLFVIIIIGGAASVLMISIALGIAKRLFGLVVLGIFAPIPLSSFIFKDGDVSGAWFKQFIGIYLCNFVQILCLIIVVNLSGSTAVRDVSVFARLLILIGGFLFTLGSGEFLGKTLGIDSSTGDTLQQLSQISNVTRGIGGAALAGGAVAGSAIKSVGGTAASAASGGVYGIGRFLGGNSISTLSSAAGSAGGIAGAAGGAASKISAGQSLAKPGSVAGAFSVGSSMAGGVGGSVARFATATSGHLYAASANRYANSSMGKAVGKASSGLNSMRNTMKDLKGA
ncbi:MAG: hypothetical protein ACK5LZ_04795 [Anaerorhabdus sp.]